jgi:hypothetical protein
VFLDRGHTWTGRTFRPYLGLPPINVLFEATSCDRRLLRRDFRARQKDGRGSEAALRRTDGGGGVTARARGGRMCILKARLAAEVR